MFQFAIKKATPSVMLIDFDKGKNILVNMPSCEHPSIVAASCRSFGIVIKNCLKRNIPYACGIAGIMIPL